MKKSILAVGAAAVVGGLGFASAAHAVAIFGAVPGQTTANRVLQSAGAIGHMLYTPYYTAQGTMGTLFNITNTDRVNGKAVKVRFRGAANSDDVLDFTLFLSPGDVWTGQVTQDAATGHAVVSTPDKSCTIPVAAAWPGVFKTGRLAPYLSAEVAASNTREGYIEVLNMADIPPSTVKGSLFVGIKHVNGVAPCDLIPYDDVLSTEVVDPSSGNLHGLAAPSGGLMGSWAVFNQAQLAVYSGNQTALVATPSGGTDETLTVQHGVGKIAFAPQIEEAVNNQTFVDTHTADPLLRTGSTSGITPLWYDLPDMSTPLANWYADAVAQTAELALTLQKNAIYNDYVATVAGAPVPMETDWVVSQPTRRYHAAVNYGSSAATSKIEYTVASGSATAPASGNPYATLSLNKTLPNGPQACLSVAFSSVDREEKFQTLGGGFSPGLTQPYCGEVFTVSFNGVSPLQASLTNRTVAPVGEAGWARLQISNNVYAPIVGFAATSMKNQATGGNFGLSLPHRWYGGQPYGQP
ncbi:MAG TPA: hypothetical protein PLH47_04860 [Ottowia sp.]|nr:hypothetical protein [Ottowia sp.]HRB09483.1 hypothetical protein [Ottowia sp.]